MTSVAGQPQRATRQLRMALLGTADIAERALVIPARDLPGVKLSAVAARDPGRAQRYAAVHDIVHVYPSYGALIADAAEFDAIYIPLVNSLHAVWSVAAVESGLHVLCEKPFALNEAEARRMVAAARLNERLLVEAFHWRYHPLFLRALDLCRRIGRLRRLEACFDASIDAANVRYDLRLGGGSFMDLGCYCVHMIRTFAGEEPEVITASATVGPERVDVAMDAALRFPSGVTANARSSMVASDAALPEAMRLRVEGTDGFVEIHNPMAPHLGYRVFGRVDGDHEVDESGSGGPSSYHYQLESFAGFVRNGGAPPTGGSDAVANMKVIDGIYAASGLGARA